MNVKEWDMNFYETEALRDALIALQDASWARSWSRLKAARKRVEELTGIPLTGRLQAMLEVKE